MATLLWHVHVLSSCMRTEIGPSSCCGGIIGVPDMGTTHKYRIDLSRDETLEALQQMMSKSNHPKLSKPIYSLRRELLTPKK